MAYSKALSRKYAINRNLYRSSDGYLTSLIKKIGIKDKTILDFGCGDGSEAERFISMGARRIVGIDTSGEMIRLAQEKKLKDTVFIKTGGKSIPQEDNKFDLVYARFVLHYIKDLKPQFVEIARVLKNGGYFIGIFQCLTDNSELVNTEVPINLGIGKAITKIKILAKSASEVKFGIVDSGLKLVKIMEVENTDAHIDTKYRERHKFTNTTHIALARKI